MDAHACAASLRHLALATAQDVGSLERALKHDADATCVTQQGPPLDDDEAAELVLRLARPAAGKAAALGSWLIAPAPLPRGAYSVASPLERARAFRSLLEVAALLRRLTDHTRATACCVRLTEVDVCHLVRAAEMLEAYVAAPLARWLLSTTGAQR